MTMWTAALGSRSSLGARLPTYSQRLALACTLRSESFILRDSGIFNKAILAA